jgi:ppGpp synthetase/RelA/SpoT-type nucleotidyltranferase
MSLPISKSALDRLGTRLAASESVSETDREAFAVVANSYQAVLDTVTSQLEILGFQATPRVKTTGTLVDKLRRQHTRLSQVQDLAGARITVQDRAAQDAAVVGILSRYESLGQTCKVDDLRDDPSHGYRAVHVIVSIDRAPVEIQVRTELQDSWAQIVEDLGDRWGRAIRYGGEPQRPEALIRAGDSVVSRRAAMDMLVTLSESIAEYEETYRKVEEVRNSIAKFGDSLDNLSQLSAGAGIHDEDPVSEISSNLRELFFTLGETLEATPSVDTTTLMAGWREGTYSDYLAAVGRVTAATIEIAEGIRSRLRGTERQLRGMLQGVADATDEDG